MTTTIKKIRNYALLGTIISASTTAPVQASTLKNVSSDELIENPLSELSKASKDISSEIEVTDKPDYCISFPESELCNQLTKQENRNSLNNPLFRKANHIIESVEAAQTTKVKFVQGRKHIVYNAQSNQSDSEQPYTAIYAVASTQKEKVPEPSALCGLIALLLLARKRQTAASSQISTEELPA